MDNFVQKENLNVGMIIYDKQPRWFDYDYHPQKILEIFEDYVRVFEEGYFPNGKEFNIPIKSLFYDNFKNGEIIIVH